jgi:oligoendopeptidase F
MPPGATGIRWHLPPLEPSELAAELESVLGRCRTFAERYEGRIAALDAVALRELLDEHDRLWDELSRLAAHATLRTSASALGDEEQELAAAADAALADAEQLLQFVEVEWLDLPDEHADALVAAQPLEPYRHVLCVKRRLRPHVLPPGEEIALAARDATGQDAWIALYDRTLASIRASVGGRELTLSDLYSRLYDPEPETRAEGLAAVHAALEPALPTIAHCYDSIVADRLAVDGLRRFETARAETDLENELPPALVDDLLREAEDHFELARWWFREKARLLGRRLSVADENAPLEPQRSIPFDEALETTVTALERLAPELGEVVETLAAEGRIDAEPRPGKTGSSFCMYVARDELPYVLVNYRGRVADALRLAHELGHAVHFVLAGSAQPAACAQAPVPIAEIPPALTQLLVLDELAEAELDPDARRSLLAAGVDSTFSGVFRQVVHARFEADAHTLRSEGCVLTASRLSRLWQEHGHRYYGSSLDLPAAYESSWASIGQFVRGRFYNYAYVFAQLAGLVLRAQAREDAAFGARYLAFLRLGASADPLAQVRMLGVEPGRAAWAAAFGELATMIGAAAGERAEAVRT